MIVWSLICRCRLWMSCFQMKWRVVWSHETVDNVGGNNCEERMRDQWYHPHTPHYTPESCPVNTSQCQRNIFGWNNFENMIRMTINKDCSQVSDAESIYWVSSKLLRPHLNFSSETFSQSDKNLLKVVQDKKYLHQQYFAGWIWVCEYGSCWQSSVAVASLL